MATFTKEQLDKVFHAYDVRGLVGEQLNDEFFYHLGKAFVTFLKAKKIVVGYDIRPESKQFSQSFIKGAIELGCDVVNIGEIATEMLYYAVGSDTSFDGGATITASHNPPGWNGCKMVGKEVTALSGSYGLSDIKELIISQNYTNTESLGNEILIDIYPDFKEKILSFLKDVKVKPIKVIIDAGNGIGGKVYDYVFGDLGLDVTRMYFEPDGNFPNHVPNPILEENVKELKERIISEKADLGIAIDGDADRVFFIDSKGRNPNGVYTGSVFAKYYAKAEKHAKIVHDPRVTSPIINEIAQFGAISLLNKSGHSFFKERMKQEGGTFGAELSSHFYYRDFYNADSGMMTIAMMYRMIAEGLDFTKEMDYLYSTYLVSGEVNFKVEDANETIAKVKEAYKDGSLNEIDGISFEFENWRFNLRKSNTEPVIRLNLESTSLELLKEKFIAIQNLIGGTRQNDPALKELC